MSPCLKQNGGVTAIAIIVLIAIDLLCYKFTSTNVIYLMLVLTPILLWIIVPNELFKKDLPKIFNFSFFAYTCQTITLPLLRIIYSVILPLSAINAGLLVIIKIIDIALSYLMSVGIALLCKAIFKEKVYCALSGDRINKANVNKNVEGNENIPDNVAKQEGKVAT